MSRVFNNNNANYISMGNVCNITGTVLTISAWVYPTTIADGAIVAKWITGATQYILYMDPSGRLAAGAEGTAFINETPALTANQWYQVVYRLDGTNGKLFRGGSEVASGGNPTLASHTTALVFGTQGPGEANTLAGRIAEVGIWNVSLTLNEIAALAKGVIPLHVRRSALQGYWPLFGIGSVEAELSGNKLTGTINGTVPAGDHAPVGRMAFQAG